MNDASRYCVVLGDIKAKDWAKLPKIFETRLREVMLGEQINPDVIERYLAEAGAVEYYRNADKQMTAWINKACESACLCYRNHDTDVDISHFANQYLVGTKNEKDYWTPSERFYALLSEYGLPLKRCRAFEFYVRLQLKDGEINLKFSCALNTITTSAKFLAFYLAWATPRLKSSEARMASRSSSIS